MNITQTREDAEADATEQEAHALQCEINADEAEEAADEAESNAETPSQEVKAEKLREEAERARQEATDEREEATRLRELAISLIPIPEVQETETEDRFYLPTMHGKAEITHNGSEEWECNHPWGAAYFYGSKEEATEEFKTIIKNLEDQEATETEKE